MPEDRLSIFHIKRDATNYPHNPKVAGSNPAPATIDDEGLADVAAANPFRLPRNHPGIWSTSLSGKVKVEPTHRQDARAAQIRWAPMTDLTSSSRSSRARLRLPPHRYPESASVPCSKIGRAHV